MNIIKAASAGTYESSDAFVEIAPCEQGVSITLESVVEKQFKKQIQATIMDVLRACDVAHAVVRVKDFGAIDCVLRARVHTAICRAADEKKVQS